MTTRTPDDETVQRASGLRQCLYRANRFINHQIRYTCGGNPARARAYEEVRDELCRLFVFRGADDCSVCSRKEDSAPCERIRAVRRLIEDNGCDCPCDHHPDECESSCEVCLACRIGEAVGEQ